MKFEKEEKNNKYCTINVREGTKLTLVSLKKYEKETMDEVINRIIDWRSRK